VVIDEALVTHVATVAAVTALIGSRFYPGAAPQNATLPHAIYHRVSSERAGSLLGSSGLADPRFQISALASTYGVARAVAEELRKAISGYQGLMGSLGVAASVATNDIDIYYDDVRIWQSSFDVFLTHQEAQ